MLVLFFSFRLIAILGLLGCAAATIRVLHYYRSQRPSTGSDGSAPAVAGAGLSMIVPIKSADPRTRFCLQQLLNSRFEQPIEFLFVMESSEDPAYAVCHQLQQEHAGRVIHIVISGQHQGRMGKQHNLAAGVQAASYDIIGSMDADVSPAPNLVSLGVDRLNSPKAGITFTLPYYYGPGPAGGWLVAMYTNAYYTLYMGSLALVRENPLIIGALWFARKETLAAIGGLEQFTQTVSDDAALGRAVRRAGLLNLPLRLPVGMPLEPLSFREGFRHLQKWVGMLRGEGLRMYGLILFSWHFVFWSLAAFGAAYFSKQASFLPWALSLLAGSILIRMISVAALQRYVYAQPTRFSYVIFVIVYELFIMPILFGIGLFKRTIVWKGRKYDLSRAGKV